MMLFFIKTKDMRRVFSIVAVILIIGFSTVIISCAKDNSGNDEQYEINFDSVRVALYIDDSVWPECQTNTAKMLKNLDIPYTSINTDSINQGRLRNYNVLLMPGGDNYKYGQELGLDGIGKVRNFIKLGGGYFGICGGAYFAVKTAVWRGWSDEPRSYNEIDGLGIIGGVADGPVEDFAWSYQDFSCKIRIVNDQHPVTEGLPNTIQYLYDHGPMFITGDNTDIEVLGKSVKGDRNFIVCSEFYSGRVFLTSGHPEFSRSVWTMVENAINWCSKRDLYSEE